MKYILFVFYLFSQFSSFAQNEVNVVLQKSLKAASQIKNGQYEAQLKMKYLMKSDTTILYGACRFHRFPPDTLKGAKFELTANDVRVLYDGRKKIAIYEEDSFVLVHDKWIYPLKLTGSIYHLLSDFYINNKSGLDEILNTPDIKRQFLNDTLIDKITCYHILLRPSDDATSQNICRHLYIAKENFYLIGESISLDAHQHHQFTELFLQNVKTNSSELNDVYGAELIPKKYFIKEFVPDQLSKLLSKGTKAPPFSLVSLEGKTYSLSNLNGKLILLYFWNALDQQSRVRMQPLQKIYDKFSSQGVEVLGMNLNDGKDEHLKKLLLSKKISFPQLTNAAITGEKYNLFNVPTIYVIGKDGKIMEGFIPEVKENLEQKLEKLIISNQ